jgi:hypothetical protein
MKTPARLLLGIILGALPAFGRAEMAAVQAS